MNHVPATWPGTVGWIDFIPGFGYRAGSQRKACRIGQRKKEIVRQGVEIFIATTGVSEPHCPRGL